MARWFAKLKADREEMLHACDKITDQVRVLKTAKAVEMQKRRLTERGDVQGLN